MPLFNLYLLSSRQVNSIHWDTSFLKENYNQLSEKILSIPCDYRYNIEDMKRIVDLIKGATKI